MDANGTAVEQSEHEICEAARKKYRLAAERDKEVAALEDEISEQKEELGRKRKLADSARKEAEALVMRTKSPQLSMAMSAETPAEPPCETDKGHTWERIRDGEMLLEDCVICDLERTAKIIRLQDGQNEPEVIEHEPWIYTNTPATEGEVTESSATEAEEPATT